MRTNRGRLTMTRGSPIWACRIPDALRMRAEAHCRAKCVTVTDLMRAALLSYLDDLARAALQPEAPDHE